MAREAYDRGGADAVALGLAGGASSSISEIAGSTRAVANLLTPNGVGLAVFAAVFLSNVPESLSGS